MNKGISEEIKEMKNRLGVGGFIAKQSHGDVCAWASAGSVSGFMGLRLPWSLLMAVALDTVKGRVDRAVQSWCHPSLVITLERTGPGPHWLIHSGKRIQHLSWAP